MAVAIDFAPDGSIQQHVPWRVSIEQDLEIRNGTVLATRQLDPDRSITLPGELVFAEDFEGKQVTVFAKADVSSPAWYRTTHGEYRTPRSAPTAVISPATAVSSPGRVEKKRFSRRSLH